MKLYVAPEEAACNLIKAAQWSLVLESCNTVGLCGPKSIQLNQGCAFFFSKYSPSASSGPQQHHTVRPLAKL